MNSEQALRHTERAVALVALGVAMAGLLFTIDALLFHGGSLLSALDGRPDATSLLVLGLLAAYAVPLVRAARCVALELRARRRHESVRVVVAERRAASQPVLVVSGTEPAAFCAGLLRPRVYVTQGAIAGLDAAELTAVLAHEAHHARRRDPLRLFATRVLGHALAPGRGLGGMSRRHAELAELAADASAVQRLGRRGPLASALLVLGGARARIAPERVDHLLTSHADPWSPRAFLVVAGVALAGLVTAVVQMSVHPGHSTLGAHCGLTSLAGLLLLAGALAVGSDALRRLS